MKIVCVLLLLIAAALCQEFVGSPISTEEETAAATAYWTPERLRNAKPRDVILSRRAGNVTVDAGQPDGEPGEVPGSLPIDTSKIFNGDSPNFLEERATFGDISQANTQKFPLWIQGKVFMTFAGEDFVCSGSAGGRYIIWTAGHCVYDTDTRSFATNWIFIPGYYGTSGPVGQWSQFQLWTTRGWTQGNFAFDYALAIVRNNNRGAVGSVLGFNGYRYNQNPAALNWVSLGYPQESPFNGRIMHFCNSNLFTRDTTKNPPTLAITCDSTGGSSGGPWLLSFSTTTFSYVNSVNSYHRGNDNAHMYGPYFTAAVKTFYDQVNAIVPR